MNKPKINKTCRKPKLINMISRLRDNDNSFNYSFRIFIDNNKKRHQKDYASIERQMADYDRLIRVADDLLNDSKFTCKSQFLSLSNMFFQSSRHKKSLRNACCSTKFSSSKNQHFSPTFTKCCMR